MFYKYGVFDACKTHVQMYNDPVICFPRQEHVLQFFNIVSNVSYAVDTQRQEFHALTLLLQP